MTTGGAARKRSNVFHALHYATSPKSKRSLSGRLTGRYVVVWGLTWGNITEKSKRSKRGRFGNDPFNDHFCPHNTVFAHTPTMSHVSNHTTHQTRRTKTKTGQN